ncbi:MAG: hypothetical protein HGA45_00835, partial [Chloroflexales bacterium]|nr:hypothetical protein [Chloroflexales bacterium]
MHPISAPLSPGDQGPDVVNLQDGLRRILAASVLDLDEGTRDELLRGLAEESRARVYADATAKTVTIFQERQQLEPSGAIDEKSAERLNRVLEEIGGFGDGDGGDLSLLLGVLQEQAQSLREINAGTSRLAAIEASLGALPDAATVRAIKAGTDQIGAIGGHIASLAERATFLDLHARGDAVRAAHEQLARAGFALPAGERDAGLFGVGTRDALLQLQERFKLARTGVLDDATRNALAIAVGAAQNEARIEGQVFLDSGLPAQGLSLRLVVKGFGDEAKELGTLQTDGQGFYALPFEWTGALSNLEIHALNPDGSTRRLAQPRAKLGRNEVINLVAPSALQPAVAEYRRLTDSLTPHIGQMERLAGAVENAERQDLSVLHRATGWDARMIALAAMAEQLHTGAGAALDQEGLYGLLRAGLPSDRFALAQVDAETVERALTTVRDAGIVGMSDPAIGAFKAGFQRFANKVRLAVPAPGALSTYSQLLAASGLSQEQQDAFGPVFLSHTGSGEQLWERARQAGLDDRQIGALQLQGKLAFLTGNSEALVSKLAQQEISDPAQLVDQDLYQPERWKAELSAMAADDEGLAALIPVTYAGATTQERLDAYAEDMARKVRVSYPTQVIGRLIERDEADAFALGAARGDTVTLLKQAAGQGFRLGQTPVTSFLMAHPGVKGELDDTQFETARHELKKLQRAYQITPANESMTALMSLGLHSAYDVVAVTEDQFIDLYGPKFPSVEQARMVYRKAKQVTNVTYNLFTIAKTMESSPPIHGLSAPSAVREGVRNELIKHFPTMESLFGSLDFCECEHCRSVLSPAAYLVDLLQLVDIEPAVWENFLARWKATHNDEKYTDSFEKPYEALIARRPDLPHIQLTCENTNVALPYIDIVNEILEYYVANGGLAAAAARDTGDASSAELLAEPQNVIRAAYDRLLEACYPLALPFDLWLETVRQFCQFFDTPLAQLLETFRREDTLFAPTQPFDRAAIFVESLGLAPAEAAIFTDPDPLADDKWHGLYGLPAIRSALQAPTNAVNATLSLEDADAARFSVGDWCAYFDLSANAMHPESRRITAIDTAGSGGAGRTTITLAGEWATPPVAGDLLAFDALTPLGSAGFLARRLQITYNELVAIVRGGFVNPALARLTLLDKLDVSIGAVRLYRDPQSAAFYALNKDLLDKERDELSDPDKARFDALAQAEWEQLREIQAFEQRLARFAADYDLLPADLEAEVQAIPLDAILVLSDPDAGCSFDMTTLRYASGRAVDAIALLRLNLFTRLWRKLGWTIEETDGALEAFVPENTPFDVANLGEQPLETALIYLAHLKALEAQLRLGKGARLKLLSLWADLATSGKGALYAQLFLAPRVLKIDPVFDHPLGQYLDPAWVSARAAAHIHRVQMAGVAPADKLDPAPFAGELRLELRYDELQEVQHLAYQGVLSDPDKAALIALAPAPATLLSELLDAVQGKAAEFTLVNGHLLAIQGALGITASDAARIFADAGTTLDAAPLSLANVSLLYRYTLLARALRLSVPALIALKGLSGLNPFTPLHADPLASLGDDHPFTQTLRFVEVAGQVRQSGFAIEDLEYLLRHRFDASGPFRADEEGTLAQLRTLAEGIRAIRAEHAVPADPGAMDEEQLRQKLGLLLPPDIVERFLAMLGGTALFTITKNAVAAADSLHPSSFTAEPAISQVAYNATTQTQTLTVRGLLFDQGKTRLKSALAPVLSAGQEALLSDLLDAVQAQGRAQADAFFARHLERQPLSASASTGFLAVADFELLFNPDHPLDLGEDEQDRIRRRRTTLARAFLPFLQQRLIRQFVVQTMTAQVGADPALVESLLTDARLLGVRQPDASLQPLLDVLVAQDALSLGP